MSKKRKSKILAVTIIEYELFDEPKKYRVVKTKKGLKKRRIKDEQII